MNLVGKLAFFSVSKTLTHKQIDADGRKRIGKESEEKLDEDLDHSVASHIKLAKPTLHLHPNDNNDEVNGILQVETIVIVLKSEAEEDQRIKSEGITKSST